MRCADPLPLIVFAELNYACNERVKLTKVSPEEELLLLLLELLFLLFLFSSDLLLGLMRELCFFVRVSVSSSISSE